jgi:hypothetical protein
MGYKKVSFRHSDALANAESMRILEKTTPTLE